MNKAFIDARLYNNGVGLWFFVPDDAEAYGAGRACNGFGAVRYREGSVYCGPLFFDGKNYNKLGYGRQDFSLSELGAFDAGLGARKAFFIGNFDYRKTDWIYGNGVLYYSDIDGNPKYFVKGFFEGLFKTGAYDGAFDYGTLANGFTPDMERDFDEWRIVFDRVMAAAKNVRELKTLYIGDSYFEFWANGRDCTPFYSTHDNSSNLNIGVGGTTFDVWNNRFAQEIETLPCPERIALNLGFNDIHMGRSAERTFAEFKRAVAFFRSFLPNVKIFLSNVVKAPAFETRYAEEEKFNAMAARSAERLGVAVIDMRTVIEKAGEGGECFAEDRVHLNPRGYSAYIAAIDAATA